MNSRSEIRKNIYDLRNSVVFILKVRGKLNVGPILNSGMLCMWRMTSFLRRVCVHVGVGVAGVERAAQRRVARDDVTHARAHSPQPLGATPQLLGSLGELRVAHAQLRVHYLNLTISTH